MYKQIKIKCDNFHNIYEKELWEQKGHGNILTLFHFC